jgi:two-component system LytT family response regulator
MTGPSATDLGVLIVEDERIAASTLERLLATEPGVRLLGVVRDGRAAISRIQELRPELVLLDVELPEVDGFEVIERVGLKVMPITIFITAYDQYTLRAFDVHACDYLLKPFSADRFRSAIERARTQVQLERSAGASRLGELLLAPRRGGRLPIKMGGTTTFVDLDHVDYVETCGNYLTIHVGATEHLLRETMNALEGRLRHYGFVRIHRSYLVNQRRVTSLRPWHTGEYVVILSTGRELTLSRGYRDRLATLKATL